MSDKSRLQEHRHLRHLGRVLHDPALWHLNRRSAAGAVALGLFVAWIPAPLQMLLAALGAIVLRVNLPVAVATVWVANPVTMPPMFWLAYTLGAWLMGGPGVRLESTPSLTWVFEAFDQIWRPLLLGCAILGALSAAVGYAAARLLWRLHVVRTWEARRRRRNGDYRDGCK